MIGFQTMGILCQDFLWNPKTSTFFFTRIPQNGQNTREFLGISCFGIPRQHQWIAWQVKGKITQSAASGGHPVVVKDKKPNTPKMLLMLRSSEIRHCSCPPHFGQRQWNQITKLLSELFHIAFPYYVTVNCQVIRVSFPWFHWTLCHSVLSATLSEYDSTFVC